MAHNSANNLLKPTPFPYLLSDSSQANKVVSRGTVDLKLALVTLVVAMEATQSKLTVYSSSFAQIWAPPPINQLIDIC